MKRPQIAMLPSASATGLLDVSDVVRQNGARSTPCPLSVAARKERALRENRTLKVRLQPSFEQEGAAQTSSCHLNLFFDHLLHVIEDCMIAII